MALLPDPTLHSPSLWKSRRQPWSTRAELRRSRFSIRSDRISPHLLESERGGEETTSLALLDADRTLLTRMSFNEPTDLGRRYVQPCHTYALSEVPTIPHARVAATVEARRLGFNHDAVRRRLSTIPSIHVSADTASAISRSLGGPALPLERRAELGL